MTLLRVRALAGSVAVCALALIAVAMPPRTAAAACDPAGNPVTWDSDAGTASWSEPTNWSGDAVPGPGAHVCIEGDATSVSFDAASASIATIEVQAGASLSVTTGTLDITGPDPSTLAQLNLFGGTISGTGARTISDTLALHGGTLSGSATTTVAAGASLTIGASGNPNRIVITGGHELRIEAGARATWGPVATDIQLDAPAAIVNAGELTISNDTQVFGSGTFVNQG
jgi:hypothetical protein